MSGSTPVDLAVTAILTTEPSYSTPRLRLRAGSADLEPYARMQTVDIFEPDSWPPHNFGVDIAQGRLPKHTGPVVLALPAPGLDTDRVAVTVEFEDADVMEALADLLHILAAQYREMHNPETVKAVYVPDGETAHV